MKNTFKHTVSREQYQSYKNTSKYPESFCKETNLPYLVGVDTNKLQIRIFEEELFVGLKTYKEKFQQALT